MRSRLCLSTGDSSGVALRAHPQGKEVTPALQVVASGPPSGGACGEKSLAFASRWVDTVIQLGEQPKTPASWYWAIMLCRLPSS